MKSITWFLPVIKAGSGGLRTVLAHAAALEKKGFPTCLQVDSREPVANAAREKIEEYYGYTFQTVRRVWEAAQPCDLAVATVWTSARPVAGLPFPTKRLYYVQDFEPWFYPVGSMYLAAEASYAYGLEAVTIGRFLARKLSREFGLNAAYHDFGADPAIYRPLHASGHAAPEGATAPAKKNSPTGATASAGENVLAEEKPLAICFLFQPGKERRAAELGLKALEIVAAARPGVSLYLFGAEPAKDVALAPCFKNLGLLDLAACNDLYNRCAVGLCLSCTNPSRVPFEMLASGLPVVDLWRENTLYDFPEEAMLLARQTPEDIALAIVRLLDDPALRERMREVGLRFMRRRTEEMESLAFAGIIRRWFETGVFPAERDIQPLYRKQAFPFL